MIRTQHMRIDPAYRARLHAAGLDTVDRVLGRVDGRIVAWSRTTDTLHVPGPDGGPGFYIKRYVFPGWIKRLRGALRGTFFGRHRSQAEYRALAAMRALGLPAVRGVAYGERRVAHFLSACFLITEEVPEAQNLTTFAQDVAAGRRRLSRAGRVALTRALAEQIAAVHASGFAHGNLFWRNVLVRPGPDGRPEFFFLDVQPPPLWQRLGAGGTWWLRELAQTAASAAPFSTRTDRLRFMRAYFGVRRLDPLHKRHVRTIAQLGQTWRRHEQRRIRLNDLFEEWNRQLADEPQRAAGPQAAGSAGA